MFSAPQLNVIVGAVFALWAIALIAMGVHVQTQFFKPFSGVVAGLGATLFFFDRIAWKWRVWRKWLVRRPFLGGTWQATLRPKDGRPVEGFMVVRQTLTTLTLRLLTAESASVTVASDIVHESDGAVALAALYRAEPRLEVRERSEIHNGAFYATLSSTTPRELVGHYWTDRNSSGELRLYDRRDGVVSTFREAQTTFGQG